MVTVSTGYKDEHEHDINGVLKELFLKVISKGQYGYKVITLGADRHGSIIYEAGVPGDVDRFITLSSTLFHLRGENAVAIEVAFVIESTERFTRRVILERVWSPFLYDRPSKEAIEDIATALELAQKRAAAVRESDLDEEFIFPGPRGVRQVSTTP